MTKSFHFLLTSLVLGAFIILTGCGKPKFHSLEGDTMGTRYHISAQIPSSVDMDKLKAEVDDRLVAINQSMSTYIEGSEISTFNRLPVGESMAVSDDFSNVFTLSKEIYKKSNGAFDPTVASLVDLWGFGGQSSKEGIESPPSKADIDKAKQFTGLDKIVISDNTLKKTAPVRLDFSAVAKGYAVDQIAKLLRNNNANNFLVEIGGEIATQGISPRAGPWRVAIHAPKALRTDLSRMELQDANMATSGDYRNYFEYKGKRYSHTINPKTGYPVEHHLHSVTVLADSVAAADAWATALLVLGEKDGFTLAEEEDLAIYMIYNEKDVFSLKHTKAMQRYLPKK